METYTHTKISDIIKAVNSICELLHRYDSILKIEYDVEISVYVNDFIALSDKITNVDGTILKSVYNRLTPKAKVCLKELNRYNTYGILGMSESTDFMEYCMENTIADQFISYY